MMFSQAYRSSSEEESSDADSVSTLSDKASKGTGTDSWYDVKSDAEQQEDALAKQANQTRTNDVQEKVESESDEEEDDDDDDSDRAIIRSVNDIYINGSVMKQPDNDTTTLTTAKEQEQSTTNVGELVYIYTQTSV